MTRSVGTGPRVSAGTLGLPGSATRNRDAGPDIAFQGYALIDPRFPDQNGSDQPLYNYLLSPFVLAIDQVPATISLSNVAATQNVTANTPMTLNGSGSTLAGLFISVAGSGYTSAPTVVFSGTSTTAPVATVTIVNGQLAATAMSNVGAGITGAFTLTLSGGSPTTAGTVVPLLSVQAVSGVQPWPGGTQSFVATSAWAIDGPYIPFVNSGAHNTWNSQTGISRCLSLTNTNASDTGWVANVISYDIYGVLVHETIAVSANATTFGKKAHKYIVSITPVSSAPTMTGKLYVGTSDYIGLPVSAPEGEYLQGSWAGTYLTSTTGYTAPDLTNPANATSGDVRGTYLLQSSSSNGARRLVLSQNMGLLQTTRTRTSSTRQWPMFGPTQF